MPQMLKQNKILRKKPINFDAICFHGEAKQRERVSESERATVREWNLVLSARVARERKQN